MQPDEMHPAFARALLDPAVGIPAGLTCPPGGSLARRFGIYRNNVTVSLIEALRAQFPATERLLGADRFRFLAREYLRADPPRDAFLGLWGERFAAYLDNSPHVARHPFVPDVTAIEFAFAKASHAEDRPAIDISRLGAIAAEDLERVILRFHPATQLTQSRFPAVSIFIDNRAPEEPPPRNLAVAECSLITRPGMTVRVTALATVEHFFFAALMSGKILGDAADEASSGDPAFDAGASLARLFGAGAICDILFSPAL